MKPLSADEVAEVAEVVTKYATPAPRQHGSSQQPLKIGELRICRPCAQTGTCAGGSRPEPGDGPSPFGMGNHAVPGRRVFVEIGDGQWHDRKGPSGPAGP